MKIKSITVRQSEEPIPVYDATSPKHHNLTLANGCVVHNTAKRSRIKKLQAVFPLKGKPLNVMEAAKDKINKNDEIAGIFAALGLDLGHANPVSKLRYGKVILLADPDVDGSHINCLLLTLFWKFIPDMFKLGKIYIIHTPEYMTEIKGKKYFAFSKEKLFEKFGNKIVVDHLKGYGECEEDELWQIAMNPDTRKLQKIDPPKDKIGRKYFEALMGKKPDTRKELLGVI
jgi:DNA gyrase subunit B